MNSIPVCRFLIPYYDTDPESITRNSVFKMALDNYLPPFESTAAASSNANKNDGFEWSPQSDTTADEIDTFSSRRAPRANPSVTLWDEVAPEVPRAYRDGRDADETSAA